MASKMISSLRILSVVNEFLLSYYDFPMETDRNRHHVPPTIVPRQCESAGSHHHGCFWRAAHAATCLSYQPRSAPHAAWSFRSPTPSKLHLLLPLLLPTPSPPLVLCYTTFRLPRCLVDNEVVICDS